MTRPVRFSLSPERGLVTDVPPAFAIAIKGAGGVNRRWGVVTEGPRALGVACSPRRCLGTSAERPCPR
jgi:hypothetical protein